MSTRRISRTPESQGIRRRELLRAGLAVLATTLVGGCVDFGDRTQIAVVWSDRELERFREVIRRYEREAGRPVEVIGANDNLDAFVRGRLRAGRPPDVVVLPQPGLVADYAAQGLIDPVDDEIAGRFPRFWTDLVTVGGRVYGAWVKAAHKSLLWYHQPLPASSGSRSDPIPATWDDLVSLVERMAAEAGAGAAGGDGDGRTPAPLAIGAADGWVLTDWLENLLVARAADLYDELARGQACWGASEVRRAFRDLADLWRVPHAFPGGGARALLTQFEESVIQIVATGEAAMLVLGDFALPVADEFRPPGRGAQPGVAGFPFPADVVGAAGGSARDTPVLVGGDVAVVLKGSQAGHELVDWLTDGPEPFRSWRQAGGYLSPNATACVDPGPGGCDEDYPAAARFVAEDFHRDPDRLRFDLSDQLPGAFAAPGGSWRILQDFFADVTGGSTPVDDAVDRAVGRLDAAAGAGRCSP